MEVTNWRLYMFFVGDVGVTYFLIVIASCFGFYVPNVTFSYRSTEINNQVGTNGGVAPSRPQNKRLQQTQSQVDEVVDIMRVNMEKVLERDAKLSQLDDRADALQAGASQFEASAGKLKNKYWWKNMKNKITLFALVIAILLVVLFVLTGYIFGGKKSEEKPAPIAVPEAAPGHTSAVAHNPAAVTHTASSKTRRRRWVSVVQSHTRRFT
ncbi:hypothetical protein EG68_10726 [Paragonimus skrjabini miyazakii]|uniref:V-SNARE coiled-coil homology domain-containing protein n=1 Tax=Paragonimus skrjabini miyazakii TaxID=59628 RepID=A0A8S9Y8A3_9TREM|nr:hypothetical protein EG68_10726 [Paragonimus skrjabini miyazakii]